MYGYSQGKASGKRAGWIPESGRRILGIPEVTGGLCAESPAGAEELAGAGEIAGAEEIAGAMAIASVGISI